MANEKRLIDANALKAEIVDFKLNLHPKNQDYGTGYFSALSVVEGMLAYATTVDAVEVVHGRWEKEKSHADFDSMKCTACGGLLLVCWHTDLDYYNYCPHCGADMRERKDNG